MYKKMHDGPQDYSIVSGKIRHNNTFHASLSALQWAAERANQSYGLFVQGLSPADEKRIQEEYEAHQKGQTAALQAAAEKREPITVATPDAFILTENDV